MDKTLVLLIALVGVVYCSRSPVSSEMNNQVALRDKKGTRQACEPPMDECFTAATEIQDVFISIDLDVLDSILNTLCATDCIDSIVEYYECMGQADLADFFDAAYCGQNDGQNCLDLFIRGIVSGNVTNIVSCALGGSCSSSCRDWLQDTANYLGCCATSLYDNSASPYASLISPSQFATCNVDLQEKCPRYVVNEGDKDVGVVIHSSGLIIAIVLLVTAFTSAILV